MSTGFQKYLVDNWVSLLNEIDTVNGLEGSMKSEKVLQPIIIKKIWGTADQTVRINLILEQIQRGDERRFKLFCKALASSDQEHIVRKYLTDCERDSTDATPVEDSTNATPVQYPREEPLNPCIKACLCKNWNEIIGMLSSNELEFMNRLDMKDIFTKVQIRKLKDIPEEVTRTEQILRWLERSSASTYRNFCHILCETNQSHLVSYFDESFLQTTCNTNRDETIVVSSSLPTKVVPSSVQQIAHYPENEENEERPEQETVGARHQASDATINSLNVLPAQAYGGNDSSLQEGNPVQETVGVYHQASDATVNSFNVTPAQTYGGNARALQGGDNSNNVAQGVNSNNQARFEANGTVHIDEIRATTQKHDDVLELVNKREAYDCDSIDRPRGIALVIANEQFSSESNLEERSGTKVDVENLQKLFSFLNFKVLIVTNLTAEEIKDKCKEERRKLTKEDKTFILCLLSHGYQGVVVGVDGKDVQIDYIINLFDGKNCERLRDKPKIFFIQACQGGQRTMGVPTDRTDAAAESESLPESLPDLISNLDIHTDSKPRPTKHEKADMFVWLATYPGYVAWRNDAKGSYFIQHVTDVLAKFSHEEHFADMVTKVMQRLNNVVMKDGYKQICEQRSTLDKKLYFLPR